MSTVEIRGVSVGYGAQPVLHDIDLTVPSGTTTAVLGASGCGKTTLLRVITGFITPDAGTVRIGDRTVFGSGRAVPPERRGVGYVRQDGGLFPHLDVAGNITFGMSRADRRRGARVGELLELVGMDPALGRRRPDELSGGQQQRVALARALALSPQVVLLDEPFSSLDTALRAGTRVAVADALREASATALLVTHDQKEALSFADRVAIMREGRFSQVGTPREVYERPVDVREAAFLGEVDVLPGRLTATGVACALGELPVRPGTAGTGDVQVVIRPEDLVVTDDGVTGKVIHTRYHGAQALVRVSLADGSLVTARVPGRQAPEPGARVGLHVGAEVLTYR